MPNSSLPDVDDVDLVIFDMDGVLVDSHPIFRESDLEVLAAVGMDVSKYDQSFTYGLRVNEIAQYWIDNFSLDIDVDDLVEKMNVRVLELILLKAKPMVGVVELLEFFADVGVKMCVASTAPLKTIEVMLESLEIEKYFSMLFSSEDCEFGKPNPEVFVKAMDYFGVKPSKSIVVEDSLNGVIASKSARAYCVAVPNAKDIDNPAFSIADVVISDLAEALKLFKR